MRAWNKCVFVIQTADFTLVISYLEIKYIASMNKQASTTTVY